jgi:hypothetical protein
MYHGNKINQIIEHGFKMGKGVGERALESGNLGIGWRLRGCQGHSCRARNEERRLRYKQVAVQGYCIEV